MITLVRYSNTGFEPLFQQYHYDMDCSTIRESHLPIDELLKKYTTFTAHFIKSGKLNPCTLFDYHGVFAFIGFPSKETKRFFLNHLTDTDLPCHVREFQENIIVYANNATTTAPENRMTLGEAMKKHYSTVYIPSFSLN